MAPEPHPIRAVGTTGEPAPTVRGTAASRPDHRAGHDVDAVDQVSSVVLLGLAAGGAALALLLVHFIIG